MLDRYDEQLTLEVRLTAAIREMRRGASIAEAALAARFYDQSALTNHFKRVYGITPLQWVRVAAVDPRLA